MTNVQIAISDPNYAAEVAHLLDDGEHNVHVVKTPSVAIDGVILVDEPHLDGFDPKDADRYILLEPDATSLNNALLWRAGVRYMALQTDSTSVTKLAVLAAELRLMARRGRSPWGILH